MGNNPSKPHPASTNAASSSTTTAGGGTSNTTVTSSSSASSNPATASSTPTRVEARRRDSVQALPTGKATAAPPSESHESATSQHTATSQAEHPLPSRPRARTAEASQSSGVMGNEFSRERPEGYDNGIRVLMPTRPINVPSHGEGGRSEGSGIQPAAPPPHESYHIPPMQAHRPPRLPLPIEEEIHAPGSPIISSADLTSALAEDGLEGSLGRRNSVLSSTTVDEDEIDDELHAYSIDGEMRKTIPTLIEWKQSGDKVYVTGTFASWNRKFRLHKEPNGEGLSAIIQLPPGTHHLKFIVDGEMRISDLMPTAVDYTNILVNYLEVSADDVPATQAAAVVRAEGKSIEGEGMAGEASAATAGHGADAASDVAEAGKEATARPRQWTNQIPQYLLDLDQPEDSAAYQRAASAISTLPPPPSLPLFLNKSILNGNTPMKDDSSVLSMPNHTVLNHLATSSIRSGVLATSATTRYRKKHVTTVLYKPTNEEDE